jgi:hypothetical protein
MKGSGSDTCRERPRRGVFVGLSEPYHTLSLWHSVSASVSVLLGGE